ncbi:MAG: hypothetical protein CL715_01905 [Chloroflexi bacterium]|nr:hypothetical protein [Chloroflexota bacterium]
MRKAKGIINRRKIIIPKPPETRAEISAATRIIRHNIGYPIISFLIFIIFFGGSERESNPP